MATFSKKISDWKTLHPNTLPGWVKDCARLWFRLSTPLRAYPNFIIIGAPKCGTTSLIAYLSQHPAIVPSLEKEVTYLRDENFKSLPGYRSCFPLLSTLRRNQAITGEGTTTYYYDTVAIGRIRSVPTKPKLFLMFREPAARAISQYFHFYERNGEHLEIHDAFDYLLERYSGWELGQRLPEIDYEKVKSDYLRYGIYAHMFPRWNEFYIDDRLRIYEFSELIHSTSRIMDDACEYLGLDSMQVEARVFNQGKTKARDEDLLMKLKEFYEPLNEQLFAMIGKRYDWS